MAFTNVQTTELDLAGGGSDSVAHDTDGAYNWIAVAIEGGKNDFTAAVTYGGQAITQRATDRIGLSYRGDGRCIVFGRVTSDGSMPSAGSNTFAVTITGTPAACKARIWTGLADNPAILSDHDAVANGTATASVVFGSAAGMAFMAACAGTAAGEDLIWSGYVALVEDLTTILHYNSIIPSHGVLAATDTTNTGTVTFSWNATAIMVALLGIVEGLPVVQPARLGEVVDWRAGLAITAPTDGTVFLTRIGERIRWRAGLRVTSTAQRQVALVGGGLETPEMTVGGTEGQVLTQHAKSPPTWEDLASSSLYVDLSVSGAHEIDYADGATHDLTLTGAATFTLAGAVTGKATDLRILLRQDGTGGRTVTWPGSVEWVSGAAPTLQTAAGAFDTIALVTVDDGASWLGYVDLSVGSSIDPATTVEAETTWGITPAVGTDTEYARQDHTHGTPAEPVTSAGGMGPLLLESDHAVPIEFEDILQASDGSDFLYASEP